jgi:pimeloyl-ACP methyl ester carboxylesterase
MDGIFCLPPVQIFKLKQMKKAMSYSGGQMSYTMEGSGQPIILLHGFGESGSIWDLQTQRLAHDYLVIIPDLPGSGLSPRPDDGTFETLEAFADLLRMLMDAESLSTCTLIGHSMGGYIALAFAEKYPDRLNALGLFHSTALADSDQRKTLRQKGIKFMHEHGAPAFLQEVIPGLYADAFRQHQPESVHKHISSSVDWATAEVLGGYYRAMMARPDRKNVLSDFKGPVLFILGAMDKTVVLEETLPQTKIPRNAYVQVMESVAHMGMREDPGRTCEMLLDFMTQVNQP